MRTRIVRAVAGLVVAAGLLAAAPAGAVPTTEDTTTTSGGGESVVLVSPVVRVPADAVFELGPRPQVVAVSPEKVAERARLARADALVTRGLRVSPDGRFAFPLAVGTYRATSAFGYRTVPWPGLHNGADFAAPSGTPLVAVADAEVVAVSYGGYQPLSLSGTVLVLRLDDDTLIAYGHLSSVDVGVGDRVRVGEPVGAVGSTGNSTGPHLHLVVAPNGITPVDPVPWLAERGLRP